MSVQPEWIVGGVFLALALVAAAFALGRRTGRRARHVRELESRLEVAAQERERIETELRGYRERVAAHFSETSERLHELTTQYRAVYDHLAQGASELCPESFEKLEGGLGLDALPAESPRSPGEERQRDASGPLVGARPATPEEAEAQAPPRSRREDPAREPRVEAPVRPDPTERSGEEREARRAAALGSDEAEASDRPGEATAGADPERPAAERADEGEPRTKGRTEAAGAEAS